jgi:hypothetical protein
MAKDKAGVGDKEGEDKVGSAPKQQISSDSNHNNEHDSINEKAAEVVAQYDNDNQQSEHKDSENTINKHHEESAAAMIDHVIQNGNGNSEQQ